MIENVMNVDGVSVYVAAFRPEEQAEGQVRAQKLAVGRILCHLFGDGAELTHRPDGSPVVQAAGREISVSHCAGYAVVAVGLRNRIGVDMEMPRQVLRRVARKFLSDDEINVWTSDVDLLRAWTIKEALYKAAGQRGVDFSDDVVLPSVSDTSGVGIVIGRNEKLKARFKVHSMLYGGGCLSLAVPEI